MKKLLSILMLSSISGLATAACVDSACATVDVSKLYVNTSNTIYVGSSGDETQLNCNPVSGVYMTLDMNLPNADAIYSTLLAAQIADKKVIIKLVANSEGCNIQYITLDKQ